MLKAYSTLNTNIFPITFYSLLFLYKYNNYFNNI